MNKILTVIPARGGSKGVPRKNIREMNGKPMLAYAIEAAKKAKHIGRVIVSTDDQEIADTAIAYGAEVPFLRPNQLATDSVKVIEVMRHALHYYDDLGESYDAVLSLQCTCPLIKPATIDMVIEKLNTAGCEAVTTVSKVRHGHPFLCRKLTGPEQDIMADFFPIQPGTIRYPRQKREVAYYSTGNMYLRKRKLLEECDIETNCLGNKPRVVEVDAYQAINIDDILDFKLAELLIKETEE